MRTERHGFLAAAMMCAFGAVFTPAAAETTYPEPPAAQRHAFASIPDEIAMARSAAPASVSEKAEILVLGKAGYKTAAKGSNGFVCLVQRSWGTDFDSPEFWNPKVRSPMCLNALAGKLRAAALPGKDPLGPVGTVLGRNARTRESVEVARGRAAPRRDVLHDVQARLPRRMAWATPIRT